MSEIKLKITGLHCESCKSLIEEVCQEIPGVKKCSVDVEQGIALVEHDGSVALKTLKSEIETVADYKVEQL